MQPQYFSLRGSRREPTCMSAVSNSLRTFVRRNASYYKSIEALTRSIHNNMIDEFYNRLQGIPRNESLPVLSNPPNHRHLIKCIRELEFQKNMDFILYKREMLWSEWMNSDFPYLCFDHMFKHSKSIKSASSTFGPKVELSKGIGTVFWDGRLLHFQHVLNESMDTLKSLFQWIQKLRPTLQIFLC